MNIQKYLNPGENKQWLSLGMLFLFLLACERGKAIPPSPETETSPPYVFLLQEVLHGFDLPVPLFEIADLGKNAPLDYGEYGEFENLGTTDYHFSIKRMDALKEDIGAGIYPNQRGVLDDEQYQHFKHSGALAIGHWEVLNSEEVQRAFYVWTQAQESEGTKAFFTAQILERAGHIFPAIKAYYATLVHFPKSHCWSADRTFVWYVGPAAVEAIKRLCRDYPELSLELVGAQVDILNGNDIDLQNDVITVNPGVLVTKTLPEKLRELPDLEKIQVVSTRGKGQVQLVQFENGHWQMRVSGQPFFIRGSSYAPTEIGLGPHNDPLFQDRWMFSDKDRNGRIDAAYDSWVDANRNGRKDPDEAAIGDFQLLKNMGVNTLRFSVPNKTKTQYDPALLNKPLLRDLFQTFGIRLIMMDFLGAYTQGSGADWEAGTDYTNEEQKRLMKEVVRAKVMDLKDEPFVLMWLLGNENNMKSDSLGVNSTRTNAAAHPADYAKFLNEVAEMIHEIDPHHPVAVGNIELDLLEYYRQYAPAVDVLGINSYRGMHGFGNLWLAARNKFDRPVVITEYGCDAYSEGVGEDEEAQLQYHVHNLRDIIMHQAGGPYEGNAIGGVIFGFLDEWWKDTAGDSERNHQTKPQGRMPFPDGYAHEEWYGIVSQGSGQNSPFERRLRKAYHFYKEMWAEH